MALELHHLHTDGPKPLYKKIAVDEYNRLRDENAELREKVAELERMDTEHTLQIAKMNGYINHLEEERRWRKCSDELPEKDKYVLAFCPSLGSIEIARIIDDEWRDFSWNFLEVTYWMPLPSAPKEAK